MRVKNKEIVIRPTDKSHKLCVSSWSNYEEQGRVHTEKDRKVQWSEIKEMQKVCNVTARALTKIFRIGEGKGDRNRKRVMDTYMSETVSIPPLAMLPKDHKKVQGTVPAARPVCLCTSAINLRPSDILSEVLAPIAREEGKFVESESTEENIYYIDETNRKVREEQEMKE